MPREALEDALAGLAPEEITGPGGLLTQLAGACDRTALGAELEASRAPAGRRAGGRERAQRLDPKTLRTELGPVGIRTARDRDANLRRGWRAPDPAGGLDDRVLDLYASRASVRDIAAHLTDLY